MKLITKMNNMELTLAELNEIYYCLTKVSEVKNTSLINYKLVNEIIDKVRDEIDMMVYENENN
jgi:hypothetical protein